MKRSPIRRKPHKKTDAPEHLAWLRAQPCCLRHWSTICRGITQAHHSVVGRGLSQRTSDLDAMPICSLHHEQFHNHSGHFAGWSKSDRKEWQLKMSAVYRPTEPAQDAF